MQALTWYTMPEETMNEHVRRRAIHTDGMTLARVEIDAGGFVPRHAHANEQVTRVESGRLAFQFDSGVVELEAGQILVIPPDVPHRVEALEATVAIDTFAPRRDDWIHGTDDYFRVSARR